MTQTQTAKTACPADETTTSHAAGTANLFAQNPEKPAGTAAGALLFRKYLCRAAYRCYRLAETKEEFCTLIFGTAALMNECAFFGKEEKNTFNALVTALAEEFDAGGEKACSA